MKINTYALMPYKGIRCAVRCFKMYAETLLARI